MKDRSGRTGEDKFPYVKGHCRVCGRVLPPRHRSFCGDPECLVKYRLKTDWSFVRKKFIRENNKICNICGIDLNYGVIHVDHIVPICKGGPEWDFENLQVTCAKCNLSKGGK